MTPLKQWVEVQRLKRQHRRGEVEGGSDSEDSDSDDVANPVVEEVTKQKRTRRARRNVEPSDEDEDDEPAPEPIFESDDLLSNGGDGDSFYLIDKQRFYIPLRRVIKNDMGIFLNLRGLDIFCQYEVFMKKLQLRPLFRPFGPCTWYPSHGKVEIKTLKWNERTKCFNVFFGKDLKRWRRACVGCVFNALSGDEETIRPAVFGHGPFRTHCALCKPDDMGTIILSKCRECRIESPNYGWPNTKRKTHCAKCKKPGMNFVASRVCEGLNCFKTGNYGYDGARTHCSTCRKEGMVLGFKRCIRCKKEKAVMGKNRHTHCEDCHFDMVKGVSVPRKVEQIKAQADGVLENGAQAYESTSSSNFSSDQESNRKRQKVAKKKTMVPDVIQP